MTRRPSPRSGSVTGALSSCATRSRPLHLRPQQAAHTMAGDWSIFSAVETSPASRRPGQCWPVPPRSRTYLNSASDIDCCFVAVLSWEKPAGPRIIRKLGSNMSEQGNEKNLKENIPLPRGIERATAQRMFPESDVDNPMIALQDYDVCQSGRVLELQNGDFWIRPTDLSWHFPILVTLREEPF